MININGHLVDGVEVWGWPWHGVLMRDDSGPAPLFALQRYNGESWPMQNTEGSYINATYLANWAERVRVSNALSTEPQSFGVSTHLVRVHGHSWPGRTEDQRLADALGSQEWLDITMITDGLVYGMPIATSGNRNAWLYSRDGEVWLMEVRQVGELPSPGAGAARPFRISLHARRFGVFGLEADWEYVAELEAPTCVPVPPGVVMGGATLPLMLQAIRSDGGHAIIELAGPGYPPARLQRGAYGFYDLNVARVDDAWTHSLTLRKPAHEMYARSVIRNDLRPGRNWLGPPNVEYIEPYTTRITTNVLDEPTTDASITACTGLIEQEQTRHCGWVYDENDVLHELECRIRVVHECDVDTPKPTAGGAIEIDNPPGGPTVTRDDSWIEYDHDSRTTTTLYAEMLRDGSVVADVSAELFNRKSWLEDGTHAPDINYEFRLTMGGYTTESTNTLNINWPDWDAGESGRLWPVVGILSGLFSGRPGGVFTPWGGSLGAGLGVVGATFRQQLHDNQAGDNFGLQPTLTIGAARLANNVWVPMILAGRSGAFANQWLQLTADSTVHPSSVSGLPPAVFGARVGPRVNGPTPASWVAATSDRSNVPAGGYDFLHGVTLPYGHIY